MKVSDSQWHKQLSELDAEPRRRGATRTGSARSRTTRRSARTSSAATSAVAEELAQLHPTRATRRSSSTSRRPRRSSQHTGDRRSRRAAGARLADDRAAPGVRSPRQARAHARTRSRSCMGDERLTYGELEAASEPPRARCSRRAGCERGDRVCLFAPKTPAAIVAMLATLKAGCAYVPIDIASPAPRVAKIVEAAEPRAAPRRAGGGRAARRARSPRATLVGAAGRLARTPGRSRASASRPSFAAADVGRLLRRPGRDANGLADDIAHLLFTSGSTGTPKGVMITHANVIALRRLGDGATSGRSRATASPATRRSTSTSRPSTSTARFLAGAELHLVPAALNLLPQKLARVHPRVGADAVVLGAVDPHLHGEVRRRRARRLPDPRARALVRRGAADAGPRSTG